MPEQPKKIFIGRFTAFAAVVVLISVVAYIYINKSTNQHTEEKGASSLLRINPDSLCAEDSIAYAFNYTLNRQPYQMTFLELGSTGCVECKKMEKVMEEVRVKYKGKVNVVFYNVRNNKKMTKHFGITLIPVQILLDKNGKECFRHTGFYSFDELSVKFKEYGAL